MTTTTSSDDTGAGAEADAAQATAAARASTTRELRPDELAALREHREFLLRSLDDLEQEHEAGDVDEHDYATLRDDYTARAARVIRAIEAHQTRVAAPRSPRGRWRTLATVAGVIVFALAAGLLVAQAAGRRAPGSSVTGNIRETHQQQVDEAVRVAAGGDYKGAIDRLDEVLKDDPKNVEAMSYKGWFQYRSGDGQGVVTLTDAAQADPKYPATHAFLAVVLRDLGQPEYALDELDRLDRLNPPAEILQMVSGLREDLEKDVATTTTTPPDQGKGR
jgi:tetratricopeptide (TPR) repeat protein